MISTYEEEIKNNLEQNMNFIKCLRNKERALLTIILNYDRYMQPTHRNLENKDYFYFNRNNAKKIFEKVYQKPIDVDFISYVLTKLHSLGIINKINNKMTLGGKLVTVILIHIDYINLMKYLCFNYCREITQKELYEMVDLYLEDMQLFYTKYLKGNIDNETFVDNLKKVYEDKDYKVTVTNQELYNKIITYIEDTYKKFLNKTLDHNQSYNIRNKVPYFYIKYQDILKYIGQPISVNDIENTLMGLLNSRILVRSFDNKYALMSTYIPVKENLEYDYSDNNAFCIPKSKWDELDKYFNKEQKEKQIDSIEEDNLVNEDEQIENEKPVKPKKQRKVQNTRGKEAIEEYLENYERDIQSDELYKKMVEYADYLANKKQLTPQSLYQNFEMLFHANISLTQMIQVIDQTMLRNYNTLLYAMDKINAKTDWQSKEAEDALKKQVKKKEKSYIPEGWTEEQFEEFWQKNKNRKF